MSHKAANYPSAILFAVCSGVDIGLSVDIPIDADLSPSAESSTHLCARPSIGCEPYNWLIGRNALSNMRWRYGWSQYSRCIAAWFRGDFVWRTILSICSQSATVTAILLDLFLYTVSKNHRKWQRQTYHIRSINPAVSMWTFQAWLHHKVLGFHLVVYNISGIKQLEQHEVRESSVYLEKSQETILHRHSFDLVSGRVS